MRGPIRWIRDKFVAWWSIRQIGIWYNSTRYEDALANIGEPALPSIIARLNRKRENPDKLVGTDYGTRQTMVSLLGRIGGRKAIPALVAAFSEEPFKADYQYGCVDYKGDAAKALGRICEPALLEMVSLLRGLHAKEGKWNNGGYCLAAELAKMGTPATEPLIGLLSEGNPYALSAASKMGVSAIPLFVRAIEEGAQSIRQFSTQTSILGAGIIPPLMGHIENGSPSVLHYIAESLKGTEGAAEAMHNAIKSGIPQEKKSATSILFRMFFHGGMPPIPLIYKKVRFISIFLPNLTL